MSSPPPCRQRRRLVGVSTKMYFSHARTTKFITSFLDLMQHHTSSTTTEQSNSNLAAAALASKIDIFIIPDHLSLQSAINCTANHPPTDGPKILFGAQNCHWEDHGEVSPAVLAEIGCSVVELNHAERRRYFGETDATTAKKAQAVIRNGMIPILCVGEGSPGEVPTPGKTSREAAEKEVVGQVERCLEGVDPTKEVWLAYEPVWAIGAKEPAGVEHVSGVVRAIRRSAVVNGREERGGMTRILYGGSAGPGLFGRLKEEDGVDGLFLGRFGHEEGQFWKTVREVAEVEWEGEVRLGGCQSAGRSCRSPVYN
ncbi:Triosephosphate isomerase [Neurospora tetraspora]|uniref:Triosephosphate isomerase n=1 Tax=Neurospora tetraspora TaxID=94610 RepID=A0AAE0J6J9_9PEZI|nr:Triosephosphate isomerase [Neurospora tetraspora]